MIPVPYYQVFCLIDSFGKAFLPEFAYFTMYLPMVIILVVRPTGLFGKA